MSLPFSKTGKQRSHKTGPNTNAGAWCPLVDVHYCKPGAGRCCRPCQSDWGWHWRWSTAPLYETEYRARIKNKITAHFLNISTCKTTPYQEPRPCPSEPPSSAQCDPTVLRRPQVHRGKGATGHNRHDRQMLQHEEESWKREDGMRTYGARQRGRSCAGDMSTLASYLLLASQQPAMSEPIASSNSDAHGSWSLVLKDKTQTGVQRLKSASEKQEKHYSSSKKDDSGISVWLTQRSAEGWRGSHQYSGSLSVLAGPPHTLHDLHTNTHFREKFPNWRSRPVKWEFFLPTITKCCSQRIVCFELNLLFFFFNLKTCLQVPLTIITGPVQRCVPAVVSQRGQGWRLRAGDAQQLTQPGSVASGSGQVDGCTTARVAEQNRSLLLQQTLDALLLTTQQLRQQSRNYIRIYNTNLKEHFLFVSFYKSSNE